MDKVEAFRQADIILQRARAEALTAGFASASGGNVQVDGESVYIGFSLYLPKESVNDNAQV